VIFDDGSDMTGLGSFHYSTSKRVLEPTSFSKLNDS